MKLFILLPILLFSTIFSIQQANSNEVKQFDLSISYLIDHHNNFTPKGIQLTKFQAVDNKFSLNFSDDIVWVKVEIINSSSKRLKSFLHSNIIHFSRNIELYVYSNSRMIDYQQYLLDKPEVAERFTGSSLIYPVNLEENEKLTIYIRNQALYAQVFDFELLSQKESSQSLINKNLFGNAIIAILFSLALYNLMLYFFGERKEHLYYSLYLLNAGIGLLYMYGSLYHNLKLYGETSYLFNITAILVPFFLSLFAKNLFDISKTNQKLKHLFNGVIFLSVFDVLIALSIDLASAIVFVPFVFLASFFVLIYMIYKCYLEKHPLVNVFFIAYVIHIIGMSTSILALFGFISFNAFTFYASGIALVIEALLFSYLLRYRTLELQH